MPFTHNLTIRKTRTTKVVETNSPVLSKLTEKKIMRKTHSYRNFSQVFFLMKNVKNVVMAHTNKKYKNTAQNRKDKGNHLVFVIRPNRWQFVTLW